MQVLQKKNKVRPNFKKKKAFLNINKKPYKEKNKGFKLYGKSIYIKPTKRQLVARLKTKSFKFLSLVDSFKSYSRNRFDSYNWQNNWQNFQLQYLSLTLHKLVNKFFFKHGLYTNKFFLRLSHQSLVIKGTSLGVFRAHKAKKKSKLYLKKLTNKKQLTNLGNFLLNTNLISYVKLRFYHLYLPRKLVIQEGIKVFKKYKKERFFWESLQLVNALFKGYASASILGGLVYTHIRRNPRRIAFVAYLKRLLDWHFNNSTKSRIQGIRIEVKGRFNAKSRAKKQIVSVGRVQMHEKSSRVEYAFIEAFTKFGSLGIKVWVCPKSSVNLISVI
jgi:hypothetical protein